MHMLSNQSLVSLHSSFDLLHSLGMFCPSVVSPSPLLSLIPVLCLILSPLQLIRCPLSVPSALIMQNNRPFANYYVNPRSPFIRPHFPALSPTPDAFLIPISFTGGKVISALRTSLFPLAIQEFRKQSTGFWKP